MDWLGCRRSEVDLIKGDFMDEEHRSKFENFDLLLVNNFRFDEELNNATEL
jgi:hypothetical protein